MSRRNKNHVDSLEALLQAVETRFASSPLSAVGDRLRSLIVGALDAREAGCSRRGQEAPIVTYVQRVLDSTPRSFLERFYFDAALIQALSEEWGRGRCKLSKMIVPVPSRTWGHQTIRMPSEKGHPVHCLDLVEFPGKDDTASIDLLDYPWLCHELGHYVLSRHDAPFVESFGSTLATFLDGLRLRTVADRGQARLRAQEIIESIEAVWGPKGDHRNWAQELVADLIALWTSGPAFIATFEDQIDREDIDLYSLSPPHPPYEVRAMSLIYASDRLGWASYAGGIQAILDVRERDLAQKTNYYRGLANPDLIQRAATLAMELCEALELPRCAPGDLPGIARTLAQGGPSDFGVELLLAAWHAERTQGSTGYDKWQAATIRRLLETDSDRDTSDPV